MKSARERAEGSEAARKRKKDLDAHETARTQLAALDIELTHAENQGESKLLRYSARLGEIAVAALRRDGYDVIDNSYGVYADGVMFSWDIRW